MLIVGGGRVGQETAKILTAGKKHKVTLIEKDMQRCEILSEDLGHEIFCGDGTLPHILEEVGIQNTKIFLAVTDDDRINVLCAMLAKSFDVPSIYARIKDPKWIEACERLGIDVIDPAQIMAYNIDARIRGDTFLEFLEFVTQDAEFKMIRIPLDAPNEQNIIDFERKRHFHVVGVMRGGAFIVPTPETLIKPNDTVACLNKKKGGLHLF